MAPRGITCHCHGLQVVSFSFSTAALRSISDEHHLVDGGSAGNRGWLPFHFGNILQELQFFIVVDSQRSFCGNCTRPIANRVIDLILGIANA